VRKSLKISSHFVIKKLLDKILDKIDIKESKLPHFVIKKLLDMKVVN